MGEKASHLATVQDHILTTGIVIHCCIVILESSQKTLILTEVVISL